MSIQRSQHRLRAQVQDSRALCAGPRRLWILFQKGRARKALVPPYLRIGGKRSMLERAMKERLLECPKPRRKERTRDSQSSQGLQGDLEERPENTLQPFPRLRKPAEVVEVELDQLRVQLQKEIRERRRDARRRRQMRRDRKSVV